VLSSVFRHWLDVSKYLLGYPVWPLCQETATTDQTDHIELGSGQLNPMSLHSTLGWLSAYQRAQNRQPHDVEGPISRGAVPEKVKLGRVSWCLMSLFSTIIWLYQGRKVGWRATPTQYRKASDISPQPWPPFYSAATQKGKGIERLI